MCPSQRGEVCMAKISLAGFKDPARRPRYIIWTGVAVLMIAAFMVVALGVTSTFWFCSEGCHKVQDDSIIAYTRSTHSEISCMACHMPPNADPVSFMLHKAEALGELYLTVTDNFELPLNGDSGVALAMTSSQCTQCHNLKNRTVTPSEGIKIDHKAHEEVNAACTVCHNRVGHKEDFELTLIDPESNKPNKKHADFMSMTACFRCHGLEKGAAAPGACAACHPANFDLKPANHDAKDFYPGGHAEMAKEMQAEAEASAKGDYPKESEEEKKQSFLGPEEAYAGGGGSGKKPVAKKDVPQLLAAQRDQGVSEKATVGEELPKVKSIFYCTTCHTEQFCSNCHGMAMPHPTEFTEPKDPKAAEGHPVASSDKTKAAKCVMCHGKNEQTAFCDKCHHGVKVDWEFDAKSPWTTKQHPEAVAKSGVKSCTSCHETKFCVDCHTGKRVFPVSHKTSFWTKPKFPGALTAYGSKPAEPSAKHALDAQKSMESCEVCHGSGGIKASFCRGCHKVDLPHAEEFKTNHVGSKKNSKPCVQCHSWKELCSNCHHVGASLTKPWTVVHGPAVNKNSAASCVEKCHKKDDCVKCHIARKVIPASHKPAKFTRDASSKRAIHAELYKKDAGVCTYCHAGEPAALPNSKFCKSCHKLEMPHELKEDDKQKFPHKEAFKKKQYNKKQCANCHATAMCDSCHHKAAVKGKPWITGHPVEVRKNGVLPCFDCHAQTSCANCHVNLAKRGLLN